MLQEGSTIVTHLLHPGDRAVGNGNTNTMIISSLWNALRNVEHVIIHGVVTHLKWEILNLHVINFEVEASAL